MARPVRPAARSIPWLELGRTRVQVIESAAEAVRWYRDLDLVRPLPIDLGGRQLALANRHGAPVLLAWSRYT